jgi:mono/diheme cytochrome c family protein
VPSHRMIGGSPPIPPILQALRCASAASHGVALVEPVDGATAALLSLVLLVPPAPPSPLPVPSTTTFPPQAASATPATKGSAARDDHRRIACGTLRADTMGSSSSKESPFATAAARREALGATSPKVAPRRVSDPLAMKRPRTTSWIRITIAAVVAIASSAGCGATVPTTVIPYDGAPVTQRSSGASIYDESCASCHGEHGEGLEGRPALIGAAALPRDPPPGSKGRTSKLATAQDLFGYVKAEMPPLAPGSLADEDAWAVVAHVVRENGASWGPDDLGPKNAASIALHR